MVELVITRNTAIATMGIVIMIALIWMMSNARYSYRATTEGFSSDLADYGYLDVASSSDSAKGARREFFGDSPDSDGKRTSKLAKLKRGKGRAIPTTVKTMKKNKQDRESYTDVLKWLQDDDEAEEEAGKYDNFQDVLDEIDRIDVSAFGINSMGNTIKRYSKNIDDRMKYAYKKNKNSRLDTSMAQLGVLTDEFRKLFAFDKFL